MISSFTKYGGRKESSSPWDCLNFFLTKAHFSFAWDYLNFFLVNKLKLLLYTAWTDEIPLDPSWSSWSISHKKFQNTYFWETWKSHHLRHSVPRNQRINVPSITISEKYNTVKCKIEFLSLWKKDWKLSQAMTIMIVRFLVLKK